MHGQNITEERKRKQCLQQIKYRCYKYGYYSKAAFRRSNTVGTEKLCNDIQDAKNSEEKKYLVIQIFCSFLSKKIPRDQQQYNDRCDQKINIIDHSLPPLSLFCCNAASCLPAVSSH